MVEIIVIMVVIFAVSIAFGVVWLVISEKKRKGQIACAKCKTKYDINNDVEWTEVRRETKSAPGTPPPDKVRQRWVNAYVKFRCVCPKCGKEKKFQRKFIVWSLTDKGEEKVYNLEDLIHEYFA